MSKQKQILMFRILEKINWFYKYEDANSFAGFVSGDVVRHTTIVVCKQIVAEWRFLSRIKNLLSATTLSHTLHQIVSSFLMKQKKCVAARNVQKSSFDCKNSWNFHVHMTNTKWTIEFINKIYYLKGRGEFKIRSMLIKCVLLWINKVEFTINWCVKN